MALDVLYGSMDDNSVNKFPFCPVSLRLLAHSTQTCQPEVQFEVFPFLQCVIGRAEDFPLSQDMGDLRRIVSSNTQPENFPYHFGCFFIHNPLLFVLRVLHVSIHFIFNKLFQYLLNSVKPIDIFCSLCKKTILFLKKEVLSLNLCICLSASANCKLPCHNPSPSAYSVSYGGDH